MSNTPRLMTGREQTQFNELDINIFCEFKVGYDNYRSELCGDTVNIWLREKGEWQCHDCFTDYSLRGSPDGHELAALMAVERVLDDWRSPQEKVLKAFKDAQVTGDYTYAQKLMAELEEDWA